jgi:hypothetical protein
MNESRQTTPRIYASCFCCNNELLARINWKLADNGALTRTVYAMKVVRAAARRHKGSENQPLVRQVSVASQQLHSEAPTMRLDNCGDWKAHMKIAIGLLKAQSRTGRHHLLLETHCGAARQERTSTN